MKYGIQMHYDKDPHSNHKSLWTIRQLDSSCGTITNDVFDVDSLMKLIKGIKFIQSSILKLALDTRIINCLGYPNVLYIYKPYNIYTILIGFLLNLGTTK